MADAALENLRPPFTAFNFEVKIQLEGSSQPLCAAAFAECDGLELTVDVKTIREGGNNNRPVHLVGPASYGQLSLKRGMTSCADLWTWLERVLVDGQQHQRATCEVVMRASDRLASPVRFVLTGCLPMKFKAPALNATDGQIAVEELQVAYESLTVARPGG
jgi:phage tail-like protein